MFIIDISSFPLVSVIIPVYNVRPYLNECVDSVINQTYKKLEIIIIDDGSTDGSENLCDLYSKKDNRIRVIHQENRGLSAARNAGLDIMTGDAVAFLDSDDAFNANYIKYMVEAMEREHADCVVCKYTVHYTNGKMKLMSQEKKYPLLDEGILNRVNALNLIVDNELNISTWNKLYKSKLWESIRFLDGHVYEEQAAILEVINCCKIIYVLNCALYMYRKRPRSICDTFTPSNMSDYIGAFSYVDSFVVKHTSEVFSTNQLRKVRLKNLERFISVYIRSLSRFGNNWSEFRKKLREKIVESVKCTNNLHFKFKIASLMICYCPWLLRIMYFVYHPIRLTYYRMKR